MKTDRLVMDTSVLISAALSPTGKPNQILNLLRDGSRSLLFSAETLEELRSRLARPKFDRYLRHEARAEFVASTAEVGEIISISGTPQGCADPDDDMFLETALVGLADCIVTGDKKHLLPMHPFKGIAIVTPATFLDAVKTIDT